MKKTAVLSLSLSLAALAAACTSSSPTPPQTAEAAPAPEAKPSKSPAPPASEAPAAPEVKRAFDDDESYEWLVDEEGKEYTILSYPKSNAHMKLPDGRVRIAGGASFEVLGETDSSLELKLMRLRRTERISRQPDVGVAPSREQLALADATYPAPPPSSDRLRLAAFDRGMPTRGHWRNGFDIVDMNGDGKLDFVQGPPRKGGDQIRIFLSDAQGAWRSVPSTVPSGQLDYGDIKVADLDADGNLDVAMAVHLRGVIVLKGDGRGGFTPLPEGNGLDFKVPVIGEPVPTFSSRRLELVDWNRDGKLDILAYSEGPTSSSGASHGPSTSESAEIKKSVELAKRGPRVFLNQGKGRWKALPAPGSAKDLFGDDLAVADLNGDGLPDFVVASNLMGRDNLIFLNAPANGGYAALPLEVRPRAYVRSVADGDFDEDGRVDIALGYVNFELGVKRAGVDLYFGGADGVWRRAPLTSEAGRNVFEALTAGDVDGDGHLDLAGLDKDGGFGLFLGDGKGKFTLETSPEAQEPRGKCRGYGLKLADLDGDGADEIVATYADEPVALYEPDRCVNNGGVAIWKGAKIER
jgi:hypothetical protein